MAKQNSASSGGNGTDIIDQQREAEEKAKRRVVIQSEIYRLNTKLARVTSQISSLTTEQSNLNTYLGEWDIQKSVYNESDILSDVVIVNVFEGVCADKMKTDIEACITEMDQTYSGVNRLNGNIGMQIVKLNQYVSTINLKLISLNNELNTL